MISNQVAGDTLLPIEKATERGTIVLNLLSNSIQSRMWPIMSPLLEKNKTLVFSHGFPVIFRELTQVIPPEDADVILVAPQASGLTLRESFQDKGGVNSSVAVWRDVSGSAKEMSVALGFAIGSGTIYETTFERETFSDLVGERGVVCFFFPFLYSPGLMMVYPSY